MQEKDSPDRENGFNPGTPLRAGPAFLRHLLSSASPASDHFSYHLLAINPFLRRGTVFTINEASPKHRGNSLPENINGAILRQAQDDRLRQAQEDR
ncbi:MAG: hypothetical protein KKG47_11510 [Proteobacteria bacterium]|nr:hypothetical protein [Pseudomonadota bacterium]MBU1739442.1 hypothetical protein [Pseudomonadota bacterium]